MNKNIKIIRFLVVILIAGLIGYYIGVTKVSFQWENYRPNVTILSKEPPSSAATTLDLSLLWEVLNRLEESYYDKTSLKAQDLVSGAISGMVSGIGDPYTVFLPKKQNTDFKQGLAGQFEGIGAELGMGEDKQIIVVSPLDGSPALKAGIKPGDAIIKVNGESTYGWTLSQAVDKIRGPKATTVTITLVGKNDKKARDINITRDTIKVNSVTSWVKPVKDIEQIQKKSAIISSSLNDSVAYIRLSQFGDSTNTEWLAQVNKLVTAIQNNKNFKGVILDLRNNPGGYLTEAQFISGEFLPEGVVVVSQEDGKGEKVSLRVNRTGLLKNYPVLVLINKGSASASEIVAAALSENGKAKLLGETSFGKGTIQSAEELGDGAGLHITIAKWLTPNDNWVHKKGITPDIVVELNEKEPDRDTQLEKAVEELVK